MIPDEVFRCGARILLGLCCHSDLPRHCPCGADLLEDRLHFLSCQRLKRPPMTVRHDWLVQLLAKLFRMAGANVTIEPRVFDQERVRPDLDIIFPDCRLLVDVTVVNPASPSRTSRVQLATAKTAEARKLARYGDLARAHESKFLLSHWNGSVVGAMKLYK